MTKGNGYAITLRQEQGYTDGWRMGRGGIDIDPGIKLSRWVRKGYRDGLHKRQLEQMRKST